MRTFVIVPVFLSFALFGGCQQQPAGPTHSEFIIIWGDPQSDAQNPLVRDANNIENRGILVDEYDRVVFVDGQICTDCEVKESTIYIDGEPRIDIRFGPDRGGEDARRPYLVSYEGGAMIEVQTDESGDMMFEVVEEFFEDTEDNPDDKTDDLAERDGLYENPFYTAQ